ncbi:hypothetical protein BK133_27175 [Paenibacillus sp. FSL H8-0548]|uniref:dsDNA nuclease domain-containing protein n=1 Tax=Paenibacillus sp. FSL H8-0548 TaxID=1920422 RepID=UPI00096CB6EF|nr:dsDNA nuclease domain-containing protein [Paenibacillus sp. FSL H8-0548]OMF22097.1 hypothetical protein BK133_27175 [Paenibacillus sp. FSL H8-0548]
MIEKVTAILSQLEHDDDHQNNEFIEKINDGRSLDLIDELLNLNPDEIGGRTALAGFYYQFLVALEYVIEMLDGKWDFVAVELHDDIIVGKENHIRFIQVKSSQKTHMKVSETGLIDRKKKTIENVDILVNNSWLDKLLFKAKHFPPSSYKTEFELITSYIILKNDRGFELNHYNSNVNFGIELADDDGLLSFMTEEIYTNDGQKIDTVSDLGESIKEALSRFRIEKKGDLPGIQRYINYLLVEFSKRIQKEFLMSEDHFFSLIGILMNKCARVGNNQVLVIRKEEMDGLLQNMHDNLMHGADQVVRRHGSVTAIEKAFDSLCHQLQAIDHYPDIEADIFSYKKSLLDWVQNGGSIRQLINRYIDGKENSMIFKSIDEVDQNNRLIELFSANLLLIFIYEDMVKISKKYSSFLVKEISKRHLSFLSLGRMDTLEVGVKKIEDIILNHTEPLQQLELIHQPLKTVLQGEFRGRNSEKLIHEIKEVEPEVSELGSTQDISKVNIVLEIIPGGKLKEEFDGIFFQPDIDTMRQALREYWATVE